MEVAYRINIVNQLNLKWGIIMGYPGNQNATMEIL